MSSLVSSSVSYVTADAAREAREVRAAQEAEEDAMAIALLAETDADNKTYAKVRVKEGHTKQVNSVARKYEKFVSKVERVYTQRYRNIPRKRENGQVMERKVEPWPENGLFQPLVEAYMTAYMKRAKPKLGFKVVAKRTVMNQEDLLYCAALRRCYFSKDERGAAARRNTNTRAYGRLSSGQKSKDTSTFVKKMKLQNHT